LVPPTSPARIIFSSQKTLLRDLPDGIKRGCG
jgi:hypothetical protein